MCGVRACVRACSIVVDPFARRWCLWRLPQRQLDGKRHGEGWRERAAFLYSYIRTLEFRLE